MHSMSQGFFDGETDSEEWVAHPEGPWDDPTFRPHRAVFIGYSGVHFLQSTREIDVIKWAARHPGAKIDVLVV